MHGKKLVSMVSLVNNTIQQKNVTHEYQPLGYTSAQDEETLINSNIFIFSTKLI